MCTYYFLNRPPVNGSAMMTGVIIIRILKEAGEQIGVRQVGKSLPIVRSVSGLAAGDGV